MDKYWRPGLRVWWRRDGEAQLGLDPATILFGLTRAEHVLLDALAHADPQIDCWTVAMRLGWRRADFAAFLGRLPEHALVDSPTTQATPTARYWSLVEATGSPHSTSRFSSEVTIDGVGALGLQLADAISAAGIATVYLQDAGPVLPHDVHPGGFHTDDVGRPRGQTAIQRLRPRHPMTSLHPARTLPVSPPLRSPAPPGEASPRGALYAPGIRGAHPVEARGEEDRVDLAVVIAHGALDPRRVHPYAARDTPVLPVTIGELDIMIGPLLAPPGPCVRCVHLTLTDADPRWPALATQLASETNPGVDPLVTHLAAAVAAHQVVAICDGRPAAVVAQSLHVDGLHPVPRHRSWPVHHECGCHLPHLVG